ncbi:hypothetical protein BKA66DRAFT_159297 [Pyrenochaeta sp. MPI-SDFR-AT-0127]|nr:hypothetical protein BKA66DRAFT_159297 [Pyrenochaeta sp. MPI-SDFR-AT-0127]
MAETSSTRSLKPTPHVTQGVHIEAAFQQAMELILVKLNYKPSSITTEDARRLSENAEARDERSTRIIAAVKAFAVANKELHEQNPSLIQGPHKSLLTVVEDLHAAVDFNPNEVSTEVLENTQNVIDKMEKAVGHINAPSLDEKAPLQEDLIKVEPRAAQETITKADADHILTREAHACDHTE